MYEDLVDVFDDLELGCATRRHLPRILNGWSAMHRTRCDCNGGARNTTYNQREPSAFVRDPLRTHKTAHRLGETSETACSRSVAMAIGSVVRDGATCVVRAIDGDRGGARDSSRLITVCCVSPPLRSAFLQLMTLRSTSSNPYHFNFFSVRFFSRGPRPLLRRALLGAAARTRRRLIGSLP